MPQKAMQESAVLPRDLGSHCWWRCAHSVQSITRCSHLCEPSSSGGILERATPRSSSSEAPQAQEPIVGSFGNISQRLALQPRQSRGWIIAYALVLAAGALAVAGCGSSGEAGSAPLTSTRSPSSAAAVSDTGQTSSHQESSIDAHPASSQELFACGSVVDGDVWPPSVVSASFTNDAKRDDEYMAVLTNNSTTTLNAVTSPTEVVFADPSNRSVVGYSGMLAIGALKTDIAPGESTKVQYLPVGRACKEHGTYLADGTYSAFLKLYTGATLHLVPLEAELRAERVFLRPPRNR